MSYPGSQQQFGHGDFQHLQQQLMLARLQQLQKQQQLGQFGDGKPSSSLDNISLFAKHASSGQIPNLGSGTPFFHASNMISSGSLNWMHHNVSSSTQGITRGTTYPHGEGVIMSSAMLQPGNSLYRTPVTSEVGYIGHSSSVHGASHSSVNMLSIDLDGKPSSQVPAFANSYFGNQYPVPLGHGHPVDESFMLKQGLQEKGSVVQTSVHMLNSGMFPGNFPHLDNFTLPPEDNTTGGQLVATRFLPEQNKQTNDSQGTATLDPLEEKILFDTEDSGWDNSLSKLAAIDTTDIVGVSSCKKSMNAFSSVQSGSWSALMQSAVAEASSTDTGIHEELSGLSFQNIDSSIGKNSSNFVSNEHQQINQIDSMLNDPSRWSEFQQLPNGPVPAGNPPNDHVGLNDNRSRDTFNGSRTSALSMLDTSRNDYRFIQQAADSHSYLRTNDNTTQEDYKTMACNHLSSNNPMADALYKRAAEIHGSQNRCHRENSCDSYNSKVSQVYVSETDHACLNSEDSESSARSSHNPQNQAICISSPGANSQLKSTDAFPTNTNLKIEGKSNLSAEALSKGSPASEMSASFDSQKASEQNNANQPRDHRSTEQSGFNIIQTDSQELVKPNISVSQGSFIPDRFIFQNSVPGDTSLLGLGNGQKGQTWWMPSSSGHLIPPLQGASLSQDCSDKSNNFGKSEFETLNLKSDSPMHMSDQHDGEHAFKVSKSIPSTYVKSQHMSLCGLSPTQDCYTLKDTGSCLDYTSSGALSGTQSVVMQATYHQGMKPHNMWVDVPSQKDGIGLSSSISLRSRSSALGKDSSDDKKGLIYEVVDLLKDHESAEKYPTISTDTLTYAESFINQQRYVNNGLVQRSPSGTSFRAVPSYSQLQPLPNMDNVKHQVEIAGTDIKKVASNLPALSNLNKQWIPVVQGQQPPHKVHDLAQNDVGKRLSLSANDMVLAFSSGGSSSVIDKSSPPAALQYVYSHKPVFAHGHLNSNNISDRLRQFNGIAAHSSITASEYVQLKGTITQFNGIDASPNYCVLPCLADQMVTSEKSLLSSVLPPDVNFQLISGRTRKRKTAMYDCIPWHQQVIKTCQALPDISTADQEWAEVTNQLIEKCIDGGERNEEMQFAVRAKRRLITTTKLMQLIIRPPPRSVHLVDACKDYEIVAYFVSKFTLADACSWSNIKNDFNTDKNTRKADYLSEKATELVEKTKELETIMERLSTGFSAVDVRVECQELEKFSVINHFAKYHCRGLGSPVIDTTSLSAGVASVRPFLQRYVSAVPLPPKLPEGVHCLSL